MIAAAFSSVVEPLFMAAVLFDINTGPKTRRIMAVSTMRIVPHNEFFERLTFARRWCYDRWFGAKRCKSEINFSRRTCTSIPVPKRVPRTAGICFFHPARAIEGDSARAVERVVCR